MSRFLLILLLMSPATANEPTVDQMLSAYAQAGWVEVRATGHPDMIYIDKRASPHVDRVVMMIAHRAKGACS